MAEAGKASGRQIQLTVEDDKVIEELTQLLGIDSLTQLSRLAWRELLDATKARKNVNKGDYK